VKEKMWHVAEGESEASDNEYRHRICG